MSKPKIIIVGGGTAGWMAALYLEKTFINLGKTADITVIESSKIPNIGVGEGTTAVFWSLLNFLGIDEFEFVKETKATYKFGIRHKNWQTKGVYYDGPIDLPHLVPELENLGREQFWFYQECLATKKPITDIHLFSYLMEKARAPYTTKDDSITPLSNYIHAYHFDQAKVGAYFRKKRIQVKHLDGIVKGAELNSHTGAIDKVILDDGSRIYGDLFVDCSGFRRILISNTLGGEWVDKSESLPVNRALPFWMEFEEDEDVLPFTLAEALDCGWMWTIPTQERKGCGYVYSDKFIDPEDAMLEVENYLGKSIEPRNDIRFTSGFLKDSCIKNCLSLGLSQCFFEPLEATSIHSTILQLIQFVEKSLFEVLEGNFENNNNYNHSVYGQNEDILNFINLHYSGGRQDTPFWKYVQSECLTPHVSKLLQSIRKRTPKAKDFSNEQDHMPSIDGALYFPILDGLGKLNPSVARRELSLRPKQRKIIRQILRKYTKRFQEVSEVATGHRSFLENLNQIS